ncbi:MAG: YaiI/YqxD family protein [Myxococcota bacterium]|nr:YaiI/YqxD family protein [Myxococcota bacterium]
MIAIFVDGDACPVKDETYLVAARHGVPVAVVANSRMFVPEDLGVELILVEQGPDVADDYIAEHSQPGDVVVTADVPLAARCLEAGACVIGTNGREFTEDSIGGALATRDLKAQLREGGAITGGPAPLSDADRSRFSARLDDIVVRCLKSQGLL